MIKDTLKADEILKLVFNLDREKIYDVSIKEHKGKRSLNSNSYAWCLIQKIAESINSDKHSVYIEMLKKYSREFTFVICKEKAVPKLKELYSACIDLGEISVNGMEGHQIQVFYGSSTFDSKSMSIFIDGIVQECKELGIETMTPLELERMKSEWNNGK